jgi:ABC-type antimicrobial peptide transport system ATPase subunit
MSSALKTKLLTRSVPRRPISPSGLRALGEALQGLGISFRVNDQPNSAPFSSKLPTDCAVPPRRTETKRNSVLSNDCSCKDCTTTGFYSDPLPHSEVCKTKLTACSMYPGTV